jgi:hypothetical protein
MKKLLFMVLVVVVAMLPVAGIAQEANVQVTLSQPLGPEEDIGQCVLYVSPTGVDTEFAEASRIDSINPLDPAQQNPLVFTYSFYAPPSAETSRYFKTTFIDTAGNESGLSSPVVVKIDKLPPGAPIGLTADGVEIAD